MEKSSQNPSFGQGLEIAGIILKALASAAKKTNADLDRVQLVVGKPGVLFHFFESLLTDSAEVKPSILRLISEEKPLTLKALKGDRLISGASKVFTSFISGDFVDWGVNKPGIATQKTSIQVHEMVSDGKFMEIFSSLPGTWAQKWLSQDQVIEFCETLPDWLRQEGYATFFLIKKNENKPIDEKNPEDNLVVVFVFVRSGGLRVTVDRLENDDVWYGGHAYRVVTPQLIPLDK